MPTSWPRYPDQYFVIILILMTYHILYLICFKFSLSPPLSLLSLFSFSLPLLSLPLSTSLSSSPSLYSHSLSSSSLSPPLCLPLLPLLPSTPSPPPYTPSPPPSTPSPSLSPPLPPSLYSLSLPLSSPSLPPSTPSPSLSPSLPHPPPSPSYAPHFACPQTLKQDLSTEALHSILTKLDSPIRLYQAGGEEEEGEGKEESGATQDQTKPKVSNMGLGMREDGREPRRNMCPPQPLPHTYLC